MATQNDLRAVAGKALADPEFRQKLIDDPEAAVKEVGIELSGEQMKALKEMDKEQLEHGLADLDERLTMSCWVKSNSPLDRENPYGGYTPPCGWK